MPTTWSGVADFIGSGNFIPLTGYLRIWVPSLGQWSASGVMITQGVKPPNKLVARFAGSSTMNVVMLAPRLTASARFVGIGSFKSRENSEGYVLSTKHTHRYSFPTNPIVPFVRRPSARYHAGSVRFGGRGGLSAIAS